MAADYIGIKMEQSIAIRELISERTGVPSDHILLAALHQHTSPCLADPTKKETSLRDKVFLDVVYRRFADAAVMALDDRAEASISVGAREVAEPIAFVRRYFTREAGVVTNPSSKFTLTGRCADADRAEHARLVKEAAEHRPPYAELLKSAPRAITRLKLLPLPAMGLRAYCRLYVALTKPLLP